MLPAKYTNLNGPLHHHSLYHPDTPAILLHVPHQYPTGLWVMLRPDAAFSVLRKAPVEESRWLAIRRPLAIAVVLGCCFSLMTAGRLTLRLVIPATLYWSFVPLLQMVCVVFSWRRSGTPLPLARTLDLFFAGGGPWLLWTLA